MGDTAECECADCHDVIALAIEVGQAEGRLGVCRRVEKVAAAKVFIALAHARVERGHVDVDFDARDVAAVFGDRAREGRERAANRGNAHVLDGELDLAVCGIDGPLHCVTPVPIGICDRVVDDGCTASRFDDIVSWLKSH